MKEAEAIVLPQLPTGRGVSVGDFFWCSTNRHQRVVVIAVGDNGGEINERLHRAIAAFKAEWNK